MNYKCKICGDMRPKRRAIEAHVAAKHKYNKPVSKYFEEAAAALVAAEVKPKRACKKRAKDVPQASIQFIDLPITVRVYLSAIGSVG